MFASTSSLKAFSNNILRWSVVLKYHSWINYVYKFCEDIIIADQTTQSINTEWHKFCEDIIIADQTTHSINTVCDTSYKGDSWSDYTEYQHCTCKPAWASLRLDNRMSSADCRLDREGNNNYKGDPYSTLIAISKTCFTTATYRIKSLINWTS